MQFEIEYLQGLGTHGRLKGTTPNTVDFANQAEAEEFAKRQYPTMRVLRGVQNLSIPSAVRVMSGGKQVFLWTKQQAQAASAKTGERY